MLDEVCKGDEPTSALRSGLGSHHNAGECPVRSGLDGLRMTAMGTIRTASWLPLAYFAAQPPGEVPPQAFVPPIDPGRAEALPSPVLHGLWAPRSSGGSEGAGVRGQ